MSKTTMRSGPFGSWWDDAGTWIRRGRRARGYEASDAWARLKEASKRERVLGVLNDVDVQARANAARLTLEIHHEQDHDSR